MLIKILIVLAVFIVAFAIIVSLRPADFRVMRSASISAPPAAVFAQVNDLHKWEAWSPWAKLDPTAKNSYDGSPAGIGATFAWSGNSKIGEGRMTITESHPSDLIRINIDFLRPFKANNTAEFTFKPERNQTLITWTMLGKNNFFSKAMQLFINCDKMIGGDFEKGLAQLKTVTEAVARK